MDEREYDVELLAEDVTFNTTESSYEIYSRTYGKLFVLRAKTYQPSLPRGRGFFRTYLWTYTSEGFFLLEEEFSNFKSEGWRLVARVKPKPDLSYYQKLDFFEGFMDNELPKLVEDRPWGKRVEEVSEGEPYSSYTKLNYLVNLDDGLRRKMDNAS